MRSTFDHLEEADVPRPVLSLIKSTDGKFVDGHNRLRVQSDELDTRLAVVEKQIAGHEDQFRHLAKRTTDVSSIRFSPSTVVALVLIIASIIGGFYGATSGIRDSQEKTNTDIGTIKTTLTAQDELRKSEAKLQDERAQTMSEAIKKIEQRYEMFDLKLNSLRETVLTNQRK